MLIDIIFLVLKWKLYIKYLISGGTAAIIDLLLLFFLHDVLNINLIPSTLFSFTVAIFVSFYMQKFWTFRDNSKKNVNSQFVIFLFIGIIDLVINTNLVYFLTVVLNINYLFSQIIVGASLAFFNFVINKFIIFKKRKKEKKKTKKTKNILLATGIYPPDIGGPASYTKTLYKKLISLDYNVKIITYSNEKAENESNIYRVLRRRNTIVRYFVYFIYVLKLAKWADIIYMQGPVSEGFPSFLACKLLRKPYILKIVGDYAWEQSRQRFQVTDNIDKFQKNKYGYKTECLRKIQKNVARNARLIITPSNYLMNIVHGWGVDLEKIIVIYNAVKKAKVDKSKHEIREDLKLHGDIIISAGRLVPWKGFSLLIEIMPNLLKINNRFVLVIVGDGPCRDELSKKVDKLNLKENVIFAGKIDQDLLWKYIKASDLFVLNTSYEGLSHQLIEVMQIGVPIITTNRGGNNELIVNNQNGFLVNYNDEKSFQDSIISLINNDELKNNFIRHAMEEYKKKYSYETMIYKLDKVLSNFNI